LSLITRCPGCGTAFRVQREQLAAHFGTVRCGKCGHAFNGVAALVGEGHRPRSEAPLAEFLEEPRARSAPWLWALLSVAAAAALVTQLHLARSEAIAWVPQLRPAFEAACRLAGCTVPLPRRPELIRIMSSDMHNDPARQLFVLNALLRNVARFPQQYPDLELTLTDAGKPLTRRVLRPAEYLEARVMRMGLEAGAEEALRVHVDATGVPATNYELCIYPHECLKQAKQ
jgi:predicted Zn finger-like uncharacterized protein